MDTTTVVDLGQQALWMAVLISAPLLVVALVVGLIIGVLQAATSINEATLSFIPKLLALGITLVIHTIFYKGLRVPLPWGVMLPLQW